MTKKQYSQPLTAGVELQQYRIIDVLDVTDLGITYKAKDTATQSVVVIKEFLPCAFAMRESESNTVKAQSGKESSYDYCLAEFLAEATGLLHFLQPNIVNVQGIFSDIGTAYLVMDIQSGQSLTEYLSANGGRLSESQCLAIFIPLLDGLSELHESGVVHHNISPNSIYLRDNGQPVLTGFELAFAAVALQSGPSASHSSDREQQSTYSVRADAWTDLYAVGCVLYLCITGKMPVELDVRQRHMRAGEPDPLKPACHSDNHQYSKTFLSMIDQLMALPAMPPDELVGEIEAEIYTVTEPVTAASAELVAETVTTEPPNVNIEPQHEPLTLSEKNPDKQPASVEVKIPEVKAGAVDHQQHKVAVPPQSDSAAAKFIKPAIVAGFFVVLFAVFSYLMFIQETQDEPVPLLPPQVVSESVTALAEQIPEQKEPALVSELEYKLSVVTIPEKAKVEFVDGGQLYTQGLQLKPGSYSIRVSAEGYEDRIEHFSIVDAEKKVTVSLAKKIAQYRLKVSTSPADAKVEFLGIKQLYQPNMLLNAAHYNLRITATGFQSKEITVDLTQGNTMLDVVLIEHKYQLTITTEPQNATIQLQGVRETYRPGILLPENVYQAKISADSFEEKTISIDLSKDTNLSVTLDRRKVEVKGTAIGSVTSINKDWGYIVFSLTDTSIQEGTVVFLMLNHIEHIITVGKVSKGEASATVDAVLLPGLSIGDTIYIK